MIRVILDTSVSALLQPLGPSAQIFVLALGGLIQHCVSGSIHAEYEDVISLPRLQRSQEIIAGTLQDIREKGLWIGLTETVHGCQHPDDDIFLECEQAAQAHYLVTGNLKHFPGLMADTMVVTPRWFLDQLLAEKFKE
jgi:putative PIN family toxin of toxin-antitoxin system